MNSETSILGSTKSYFRHAILLLSNDTPLSSEAEQELDSPNDYKMVGEQTAMDQQQLLLSTHGENWNSHYE